MFYYLNGTVASMQENLAVIDCNGVGYACFTTVYTQSQLRVGQVSKLYTYCNIREDAFDIFGFATLDEKSCFERLLSVSGVGPKAALAILSVCAPEQFALAVITGDEKSLMRASGVGKKMAQRIILELKDKIAGEQVQISAGSDVAVVAAGGTTVSEATAALAALGYSQSEIGTALRGVKETMSVEEIVRHALRAMVMR